MADMDNSLALLGLLGTEPSYGYDLKHGYDRWFGAQKPLAFGQVYATLARLVKHGSIVLLGDEAGEGPERKRYDITPQGRSRVDDWLLTPETPSESMQSNLFARTVIAIMLEQNVNRLLDLQRQEHMRRMRELTRQKQGSDLATVLLCDHALFHIDADLRWIDLTTDRLEDLREQVVSA
ncbi:MAG: PadR family transcriptional regulator [Mycobacteriaceae bacterium]